MDLSIELRQERENKSKLEKELKLSGSSAYHILLDAIYAAKCIKTDKQKRECLEKLKETSISLGGEYQRSENFTRLLKAGLSRSVSVTLFFALFPTCSLSTELSETKEKFSISITRKWSIDRLFFLAVAPVQNSMGLCHT